MKRLKTIPAAGVASLLVFMGLAGTGHAEDPPATTPRMTTQPGETGNQLWSNRCRMCHGSPGMLRNLGVKIPDEVRPWRLAAENPPLFKQTVKDGRKRMPSFYALTDAQLADLQSYLVRVSSPSSPVPPK